MNKKQQDEVEQPVSVDEFMPQSKHSLTFHLLVRFFNKVLQLKGRSKTAFIKNFVKALFKTSRAPNFVYSILRLILPSDDRERGNYGLKEKNLSRHICSALGLGKEQLDRLRHFKNPAYHSAGQTVGDFAAIVQQIVGGYCQKLSSLTISKLNELLDQLVDSQTQERVMIELLKLAGRDDIKWLIRIILKDLKLGIKTQTVLQAYHPDAMDHFNLTNSLKQLAAKFQDQNIKLGDQLLLFNPIKPMLAAKKPLTYFQTSGPLLVETKFDGERLQCHFTKQRIALFSRNGKNYTHVYKSLAYLLPKVLDCQGCILDGEVVVLQILSQDASGITSYKFVEFGMNKTVALNQHLIEGQVQDGVKSKLSICYQVFDVLWVRGRGQQLNLLGHQLSRRKKVLQKILTEIKGKIQIVRGQVLSGTRQIEARFTQSIQGGEEGIILKRNDSLYVPSDRTVNWFKLKADYIQGLTDSMDLIVLAGFFGQSSYRTGTSGEPTDHITRFLLGVIQHFDKERPELSRIIPFCKVGTGYKATELQMIRHRLRGGWMKSSGRHPGYVTEWVPKQNDDKPDFWISSPDKSLIFQVKSSQLIKSNTFGLKLTPRFPRVLKVRYDKDWNQGMSLKDYNELADQQIYTKNMKRKRQDSDEDQPGSSISDLQNLGKSKKRKVRGKKSKQGNQLVPWYVQPSIQQLVKISDIFNGLVFHLVGFQAGQKSVLERIILQHGGQRSQNYLNQVTHIVGVSNEDFRIRTIVEKLQGRQPLFVRKQYLLACHQQVKLLHPSLSLVLFPLFESQINKYDRFGDSLISPTTKVQFDLILAGIKMLRPNPDLELRLRALTVARRPLSEVEVKIQGWKDQLQQSQGRIRARLGGGRTVKEGGVRVQSLEQLISILKT